MRLDAHVHTPPKLDSHRAHGRPDAMLTRLQVENLQSHRASLGLDVERAAKPAASNAAGIGGQAHQPVHIHQVNLARVGFDGELTTLEVANVDAARVRLQRGAHVARDIQDGAAFPAAEPVEASPVRIERYADDVTQ